MSLRIVVVDDHGVVRPGVLSLLKSHEGWEVCGEATNGRNAVEQSRQLRRMARPETRRPVPGGDGPLGRNRSRCADGWRQPTWD